MSINMTPEMNAAAKQPIEQLGLTPRENNILRRVGVNTIEEVLECPEEELLELPNIGETTIENIRRAAYRFFNVPDPRKAEKAPEQEAA